MGMGEVPSCVLCERRKVAIMAATLRALPFLPACEDEFSKSSPAVNFPSGQKFPISIPRRVSQNYPKPHLVVLPEPVRLVSPKSDPRRVIVVAAAVAVTAGALTPVFSQAPVYEGSFQLASEQVTTPSRYGSSPAAQPNIAPPSPIDSHVLESYRLLEPVVQQLQLPHLSYQSLAENLTITTENGRMRVTYRDADPQRVQLVLSQLSQAYVNYGQECQGDTCLGIEYIEGQIPQVQAQIQILSTEIEQLHQQYGVNNLQVQLKQLDSRTTDLSKQEAQLEGQLAEARQTYTQLQQRLALKADEAIATQLLSQDSRYRMLLAQFQTLDQQFAPQFANLGAGDPNEVRALQAQHQRVMNQLTQQAQSTLQQYLSNPAANTQNPVFQNGTQLQLLQQSVLVVHATQMMEARQATLALAKKGTEQQRGQMIQLLGRYDALRHKLDAETQSLQQYFDQLEELQQSTQSEQALKMTQVPEVVSDRLGQPEARVPDLQRNLGIGAAVGLLIGAGIAAAIDRQRGQPSPLGLGLDLGGLPVDMLISKAKGLADLRLREQLQPVA
jgi:polysaccharide biosynthesis transport protein